jgi:hypothetical protein
MKKDPYLPVDPDYIDELVRWSQLRESVKVFYFSGPESIRDVTGIFGGVIRKDRDDYCVIGGSEIRLDKIITMAGKPGPAYDTYDAFSNACLDCNLGY